MPGGGAGGSVETSGHALTIDGARVDTGAASGTSGTWLLDPTDLTIDTNAAASIATALASGGVTVQTTGSGATATYGGIATSGGSGDITITSAIAWGSNTTLTLDAYHSVLVNANITATGSGAGLGVKYNDGGSGGNLLTGAGASVTLPGSASLTINGQSYTLITSAAALQAMGTSGYYALANNIDASGIGNFVPIGYNPAQAGDNLIYETNRSPIAFSGIFDGLGHAVSGLAVNSGSADNLGLFSNIGSGSIVRNLGLVGGSITGGFYDVGMLAGENFGTIVNDYATGAVVGADSVGGFIGFNDRGGTISSSYASGAVTGLSDAGGL